MPEPKKMDLKSMNITDDQKSKLRQLFPEVFTQDKIDFDKLRLTLGEVVDSSDERYGMTWPGKNECFRVIQEPSIGALKPCTKDSIDWDKTKNLLIEGDNLEVLKLLQKAYYGKVKMIYIDPPYNTGKEFVYPDKYAESLETYLAYSGQLDDAGKKFSTNTETGGRFHSNWLNMMYSRLFLARNLLRDDGVIFVSIDDGEVSNLRMLMNDIYGEENFVCNIIWQKKYSPQNDAKYFSDSHEHILLFAKHLDSWTVGLLPRTEEADGRYKNPDNDPRGPWKSSDLTRQEYRPRDDYEIVSPSTGKGFRPPKGNSWGRPEEVIKELIADNRIWFGPDGKGVPSLKRFLSEVKQGITPQTIWLREDVGDTQEGKKRIKELFGDVSVFETAKPHRLIQNAILTSGCSAQEDAIIMDFFAGSGSTAEAVMSMNAADNGNRRYILVQLPEPTTRADLPTVASICRKRIEKVSSELSTQQSKELQLEKPSDTGFRVFTLSPSSFTVWSGDVAGNGDLSRQLELSVDHINIDSSDLDILYELLLKAGFDLATRVEELLLAGGKVYSVADKALLICLERTLTKEIITEMARLRPARIICLDAGFAGNDQLKTNAVQIMKSHNVEDFRTV